METSSSKPGKNLYVNSPVLRKTASISSRRTINSVFRCFAGENQKLKRKTFDNFWNAFLKKSADHSDDSVEKAVNKFILDEELVLAEPKKAEVIKNINEVTLKYEVMRACAF